MALPAHRPFGSGATTIRVAVRTDQTGYIVLIGRRLWQDIGSPARVCLIIDPVGWQIMPTDGEKADSYRVTNTEQDGQPRLSVGRELVAQLMCYPGLYRGTVIDDVIYMAGPERESKTPG